MDKYNFLSETNFSNNNIHFVDTYYDKLVLCEKYNITHMIDDSIKVHNIILTNKKQENKIICLLFTCEPIYNRFDLVIVKNWKKIRKYFDKLPKN